MTTHTYVGNDLTNSCLIVYRHETTGDTHIKQARDFPPRRTYPIAVVAYTGEITRLTNDELPKVEIATALNNALEQGRGAAADRVKVAKMLRPDVPTVLALDISGGMDPKRNVEWAGRFSAFPNCRVVLFDSEVQEYDPANPDIPSGYSTAFGPLLTYVESLPEHPDVFVLTDGYAEHISPDQPERWTWLITPRGDAWPERRTVDPMTVVHID